MSNPSRHKPQERKARGGGVNDRRLSHALSWVLRHQAVALGLEVSREGYVRLRDVLAVPRVSATGATAADVERVVRSNDKQRFAIRGDEIRANQGHSGAVAARLCDDAMLDEVTGEAPVCVHGTTWAAWEGGIRERGLSRMRRRHVHFSSRPFGAADVVSGMRGTSQVLVHVNVPAARAAGIRFFRSANGVLLTEGNAGGLVPPRFFSSVEAVVRRRGAAPAPRPLPLRAPSADVYVALDFEATCDRGKGFDLGRQEIIELPMVAVCARTRRAVAEFHTYVRPVEQPRLSAFCTELTGIEQGTVDAAPVFADAWRDATAWLRALEAERGRVLLVTCGDWDLKTALPKQRELSRLDRPPAAFRRWCNLKRAVRDVTGAHPKGLGGALRDLGLEFEGRPHSGIDDTRNIARAVACLLRRGCAVDETAAAAQ